MSFNYFFPRILVKWLTARNLLSLCTESFDDRQLTLGSK